jgi:hypothetical protein
MVAASSEHRVLQLVRNTEESTMRQRRKAEPPTRVAPRSSRSIGKELIVRKKKRSAKKTFALDDLSYRTELSFSREDPPA